MRSNLLRFGEFYHKGTPQTWISAINYDVITRLKKVLGPGKTAVTTVIVPMLATYLAMLLNLELYSDNDRAVLQYGVLMSTCYTGFYMALVYGQVTTKFNNMGGNLSKPVGITICSSVPADDRTLKAVYGWWPQDRFY